MDMFSDALAFAGLRSDRSNTGSGAPSPLSLQPGDNSNSMTSSTPPRSAYPNSPVESPLRNPAVDLQQAVIRSMFSDPQTVQLTNPAPPPPPPQSAFAKLVDHSGRPQPNRERARSGGARQKDLSQGTSREQQEQHLRSVTTQLLLRLTCLVARRGECSFRSRTPSARFARRFHHLPCRPTPPFCPGATKLCPQLILRSWTICPLEGARILQPLSKILRALGDFKIVKCGFSSLMDSSTKILFERSPTPS